MAKRKNRSKKKKAASQKQKSTVAAAKTIAAEATLPKDVDGSGTSKEKTPTEDIVVIGTQSLADEEQSKTDDVNLETPDQKMPEAQNDEKKDQIKEADNVSLVKESSDGGGLLKEGVKPEKEEGPIEAENEKKSQGRVQIESKTQPPTGADLKVVNDVHPQPETNSETADANANMQVKIQPEKEANHTEKGDIEEMKEFIIPIQEDSETESESTRDDSVEAKVMMRDLDSVEESEEPTLDIVKKTPTLESQYVDCLESIFSILGLSRLIWEYWASPQVTLSAVETEVQSENATGADVALKI